MELQRGPAPRFLICSDHPQRKTVLVTAGGKQWGVAFSNKELAEMYIYQSGQLNLLAKPIDDDGLRDVLRADEGVAGFLVDMPNINRQHLRVYARDMLFPEAQ